MITYTDIKNKVGGADALFINHDVPTPIPAAGELLVKVKVPHTPRLLVLQTRPLMKQPGLRVEPDGCDAAQRPISAAAPGVRDSGG